MPSSGTIEKMRRLNQKDDPVSKGRDPHRVFKLIKHHQKFLKEANVNYTNTKRPFTSEADPERPPAYKPDLAEQLKVKLDESDERQKLRKGLQTSKAGRVRIINLEAGNKLNNMLKVSS